MMTHDPLCPQEPHSGHDDCQCDLIARVRADERAAATWNQDTVITRRVLADLRAKVVDEDPQGLS